MVTTTDIITDTQAQQVVSDAEDRRLKETQELLALRSDMMDVRAALRSAKEVPAVADFLDRGKPSQAIYALIRALREANAKIDTIVTGS